MPAYIKVPGVKGSAKDLNHVGWFQVDSVRWAASRNIRTKAGSAGNREGSSISFGEVVIAKKIEEGTIDIATRFWNMLANIETKIDICRQGSGSGDESLILFELENTLISMHEIVAEGAVPMEHLTLSYTKIKATGKTASADNKPGQPGITGYDLTDNKKL